MAVSVFGGGGGGAAAEVLIPSSVHDDTLSGGALAHWTLNGTLDEAITGGAGYNITMNDPGYYGFQPSLGASSPLHAVTNERQPGVISLAASLKLTGDTTLAGWFCLGEAPASTVPQLWSATVTGEFEAANTFWGLAISAADSKPFAYWETGAGVDQAAVATNAIAVGQWVHLTMTRGNTSDRCRLYVNGVLDTETTGLTAHSGGGSVNQIVIGHNQAGTPSHIGVFSVVLYDSELDASEVLALYNSTLAEAV